MSEPSISCPSCGTKIPLTRALRSEIEASVREQFEASVQEREHSLRSEYERRHEEQLKRLQKDAAKKAERKVAQELAELKLQLKEQGKNLAEARRLGLSLRKRELEVERQKQELALTVARQLDQERSRLVAQTHERVADEHRLKDAEKERQLAELRRQIEELKRKADQGSQQVQGEAGEGELEALLRASFPGDAITGIGQGIRGADVHHVVVDARGRRCGAILWECKNTRTWNDAWIAKLKGDQRAARADIAVLVTATLPKGCARFAFVDGVLVTNFACAASLAAVLRAHLCELAQVRSAAVNKEAKLELLYRYLSGAEFRHRVEAIVEAFMAMRHDLEQERRAAERQWARRARQIDAVTINVSGMYGDLQGLVPALPPIGLLEMPEDDLPEQPSLVPDERNSQLPTANSQRDH
jgi:hypothetical protein